MLPDQTLDWPTVAPKRMMSSVPCIVAVRGRPRRRGYCSRASSVTTRFCLSGEQPMHYRRNAAPLAGALAVLLFVSACSDRTPSPVAPSPDQAASFSSAVTQQEVLSNAIIHRTVPGLAAERSQGAGHGRGGGGGSNNLAYRGGVGGIGVEDAPKVYLVLFGSQW